MATTRGEDSENWGGGYFCWGLHVRTQDSLCVVVALVAVIAAISDSKHEEIKGTTANTEGYRQYR